jgi:carbamoyltransferase
MKILGISAGFHDASLSLIKDEEIIFAGHSERYSKKKHDAEISKGLLDEIDLYDVEIAAFYERPWVKKTRQLFAGQYQDAFDMSNLTVKSYLSSSKQDLSHLRFKQFSHHLSHAASGFQTSPFDKATVVVIDAIGEWDTISIYGAEYRYGNATYKCLWRQRYPHSIGLYYSAMTQHVGLRPLDEEYILMGMAGYGTPCLSKEISDRLIHDQSKITFKENLHLGLQSPIKGDTFDIATSAQSIAEDLIYQVMKIAKSFKWSTNLVYTGGVALNCLANRKLGNFFDNVWIMPNPGDAGASLGAAALVYKKKLNWIDPYLGTEIEGEYPVNSLVRELLTKKIAGVASGRAEFGPRALGNRSLLADPRGKEIKDKVNEIKQRQKFRPFAPVILEEHVHEFFKMPKGFVTSPYMQVIARCKYPHLFPAIIHVDGTSRVQTVSKDCRSGIRKLLERWYSLTDCPMLLNTSLNIRGEPMVNDRSDAERFEKMYNVKVFS